MPILKTGVPKLSKHHTGSAFIKVGGQQIWLGKYGDPITQEKYDRTVAIWLSNGRQMPVADPVAGDEPITVTMILAGYMRHINGRYGRADNGVISALVKILRKLYGSTPADEFGPNSLRAVMAEMIRMDWSRRYINKQVTRVRAIFRWAVGHEMADGAILARLKAVDPLRKGEARDREPVKPVERCDIRKVRRLVSRQVRALIDLQLLTGARADELVRLRATDITAKGEVWQATLAEHKTAHRGKSRTLYFGPRARKVLALFMTPDRPLDTHLFNPREALIESKKLNAKGSRRPNQKKNARKTDREIGTHFTTCSYRQAIHKACAKAKVKVWGPHRLRHNAATSLRRQYGIEAAQLILGHALGSAITEIYAEADHGKAMRIIKQVG